MVHLHSEISSSQKKDNYPDKLEEANKVLKDLNDTLQILSFYLMEQIILNKPNSDFNAMEYLEDLQPLSHYSIQSDIALKNPNKMLHN
jgi:hypothetical protein